MQINRLFFVKHFIGQQTDLEQYSSFLLVTNEGNEAVEHYEYMEMNLSPSKPVNSEYVEVWWGQCLQYHTKVNCKNIDNWTQEQLQVIWHYPDPGNVQRILYRSHIW